MLALSTYPGAAVMVPLVSTDAAAVASEESTPPGFDAVSLGPPDAQLFVNLAHSIEVEGVSVVVEA